MKPSPKIIAVAWAVLAVSIPAFVFAVTTTISVTVPGTNASSSIGGIIANVYQFALLIGGILALGAVVWGGVRYTWAAGNPSAQSEGKEWITAALYGLLLLAGAYVILYTINPNLLNLSLPTLGQIQVPSSTVGTISTGGNTCPPDQACSDTNQNGCCPLGQTCQVQNTDPLNGTFTTSCVANPSSTCPIPPLSPITDPQAQAMENGNNIVWTSSDPNVQANLTKLQAAVDQAQALLAKPQYKSTVTVNSAYRPLAYQTHLYEIYKDSQMLFQHPEYSNIASCGPIISALKAEQSKHGVCVTQSQCLVGAPACSIHAPHVLGMGVDLNINGVMSVSNVTPVFQANNIPLAWQSAPNDPVHFNLTNPPFTSCSQ